MSFQIEKYIAKQRASVDKRLEKIYKTSQKTNSKLSESIRYSLLAKGKRLRPVLCLAACETFSGNLSQALTVASAIEMIHTYSLIHDDLPSMDNDSLRRGLPTNHIVYGESTAILAGDALLTDSFNLIVKDGVRKNLPAERACQIVSLLSTAAGSSGMVEGQVRDLEYELSDDIEVSDLKKLHALKTGALFSASAIAGAIVAGAGKDEIKNLKKFSDSIGLAFQIKDDLIDEEGAKETGKSSGSDRKNKKSTYLTLLGREKSLDMIDHLTSLSIKSLGKIGRDTAILKSMAEYLGKRKS